MSYAKSRFARFVTVCTCYHQMKVVINRWNAIAQWRWNAGQEGEGDIDEDSEEDLCGICRVSYDGCCPTCKVPGDDCPLSMLSCIPLEGCVCSWSSNQFGGNAPTFSICTAC